MVSAYFASIAVILNYIALVGCLNDEGLALLSIKQAIKSYPDGKLSNWNSSDQTPCAWDGVKCRSEKVYELGIPSTNLSGFLHPDIGKLSELSHLNLRNNNFSGSLPSELFNAINLQSLVLSGNAFSGAVPTQIGNLKHLKVLDLAANSFNDSIPASLIGCTRLEMLLLDHNSFSGFLPDGFSTNLTALQKINLCFNRLSGMIPHDIGNLANVTDNLDLSHNLFEGPVPETVGRLAEKKVYVDLSYNKLQGPIPTNEGILSLGPTAFIGNPSLCGPPLKVICSHPSKPFAYNPFITPVHDKKVRESSSCMVISVVAVAMVMGICIVGLLLYRKHSKTPACNDIVGRYRFEEKSMIGKDLFCFNRYDVDTRSENSENYQLVPLDMQVDFDLEQLLKASAFLLGKSRIGIVYKVVLNTGSAVAVRRLGPGKSQLKEFQTEVEAIAKIRHPNIVSLRAYYCSDEDKLLIYDYIPHGDLATAIHGKESSHTSFSVTSSYNFSDYNIDFLKLRT